MRKTETGSYGGIWIVMVIWVIVTYLHSLCNSNDFSMYAANFSTFCINTLIFVDFILIRKNNIRGRKRKVEKINKIEDIKKIKLEENSILDSIEVIHRSTGADFLKYDLYSNGYKKNLKKLFGFNVFVLVLGILPIIFLKIEYAEFIVFAIQIMVGIANIIYLYIWELEQGKTEFFIEKLTQTTYRKNETNINDFYRKHTQMVEKALFHKIPLLGEVKIEDIVNLRKKDGEAFKGYRSKMNAILTFDDGPSTTTNQVLDVLEKYDVVATFFLIGEQINMDTLPIMQRQLKMGCELANHSYNHVDMSKLSATDIKNQITWTSSAIKNAVDYDVKFFRPPYLATSNSMYQNIDLSFIQGISCNDWESSVSASQRANTILNSVEDGSIILLHDFQGNTNTVQALPTIIEGLKNKGYTFVTVSELFEAKGVNPNQEYKIWSKVE